MNTRTPEEKAKRKAVRSERRRAALLRELRDEVRKLHQLIRSGRPPKT